MTTTHRHFTHVLIAIGALVLAMTAATPTEAKSGPALTIQAVAVRGNEIAITVANHTGKTRTGVVETQAPTMRGPIHVKALVTAGPGQAATTTIVLPERVSDDFPLGVVVDDGVPF
jgi:hypothetical protein